MTTMQLAPDRQECIDLCQRCHDTCLRTALTHCLQEGGRHVEPEHFRLMLHCAEICHTAADFMLGESPHHARVCAACAEVCAACADSCAGIGDMDECARICRDCAQHCEAMARQAS